MSLASVYATGLAAADTSRAAVVAARPPPFVGAGWTAEVTAAGQLHITQTKSADFEIPGDVAVQFSSWINTTFGGL